MLPQFTSAGKRARENGEPTLSREYVFLPRWHDYRLALIPTVLDLVKRTVVLLLHRRTYAPAKTARATVELRMR